MSSDYEKRKQAWEAEARRLDVLPLDALLAEPNASDVLSAILRVLTLKYQRVVRAESLIHPEWQVEDIATRAFPSAPEWNLYIASVVVAQINQSGFEGYLRRALVDAKNAARALDALGLGRTAEIHREALALLPGGAPHRDEAEDIVDAFFDAADEDPWDALGSEFYKLEKERDREMVEYVKRNAAAFDLLRK